MPESLKHEGDRIDCVIGGSRENLSEGWRELLSRSSNSLTHFSRVKAEEHVRTHKQDSSPHWGLLAAEIEETDKEIFVRIEIPGLEKKDCRITVQGNKLCVYGEKRFESKRTGSICHVMERAHGKFQRNIPLPITIDEYKAEASYSNGVLTVCLPKVERKPAISIQVS